MEFAPPLVLRRLAATIALALVSKSAFAVDADGDGFLAPPAGPGAPVDCNDSDWFTNPGRLEDLGSERDDNCNQRRGMVPMFGESNFSPTKWTDLGTVSRGIDTITVGVASSGAPASSTRTVAVPLPVSVVVSVKVVVDSGASALPCSVRLGTTLGNPPGALSWATQPILGLGAQMLNFVGVIAPGRTLRKVEISCIGSHSVGIDWLQVQDADVVFGPMNEAAVDWQDVRHPVNDASIGLVRDNGNGKVWLGTDSSGVALMDSTGWHVQNGWGSRSLIAGGVIGVSDILPMEDGSEEVFALTGDVDSTGPVGGLWRSPDDGENWDQIGSSIRVWPPAAWGTTDDTYLDDVAAYQLESNCPGNHAGRQWQWGGGHHLVGQSVHPITSEPVYIANGDWDNLGVSVYDVANDIVCPMATTGDALPADRIGALLRVDALPYGTPTLVVGYRGRNDLGASVYVCELPAGGVDCTGATSADCQVVDVDPSGLGAWDLSGVDVRDLEEDTWLTGEGQIIDQVGVLIADGGSRPGGGDADADGVADNVCDGHGSAIHELLIDDAAGYLTVDVDPELATELDFPQVFAGVGGLTGISLDPLSQYVFANIPVTESAAYRHDRLYRVPAADLLGGASIPLWEAVNSGVEDLATATAYNVVDPYEQTRMTYDLDLSGAWLEAVIHGQATVFPARSAPGFGWDIAWLWSFTFGAVGSPPSFGVESLAAIPNAGMVWAVSGLNSPWIDNEPNESAPDGVAQAENDVRFKFWPTIDVSRKQTFQGVPTAEVAIARDGHIWSANGDQAIAHTDGSAVATPINPEGAEIDCLWHAFKTASNSIVAVDPLPSEQVPEVPPDPVIWATIASAPGTARNPQAIAVVRTMDNGASWRYSGAGFLTALGAEYFPVDANTADVTIPDYGARNCLDDIDVHQMEHFATTDTGVISPATAFSTGMTNAEARDINTPSFGMPTAVRALNEMSAIVLFRPTEAATLAPADGSGDTGSTEVPVTDGGIYLTIDGGGTWHPVEFDGGDGGCDERDSYTGGKFELIHPGVDSVWDVGNAAATYDLLYTVTNVNYSGSTNCAMARITLTASPSDVDPIAASWIWYSLGEAPRGYPAECLVEASNLAGATPSQTGEDAMIYGAYRRFGNGTEMQWVQGGVCSFDLATYDLTAATTLVISPYDHVYGIGAVTSHPQVADVWAVLPTMDGGTMKYCTEHHSGMATGWPDVTADCSFPWPLLTQGSSTLGYMVSPTRGPYDPTSLPAGYPTVSYPSGRPSSAVWSEIGIPDDSADGTGSWLVVGTLGQGVWRGELSW